MILDKTIWISFGIVLALYLLYKIFFGGKTLQNDFDTTYNKILTSEEHKVKGQYEK
jgi:predicted membrane metal-binding protein|tara:strand:- start:810 stop:977 length:168 start_codon:yes stop_codon:yes gene_type:complete